MNREMHLSEHLFFPGYRASVPSFFISRFNKKFLPQATEPVCLATTELVLATRKSFLFPGSRMLNKTFLPQATEPVCLGCALPVDGSFLCPLCAWPLCGPQCPSLGAHAPECRVSQGRKGRVNVTKFGQVRRELFCFVVRERFSNELCEACMEKCMDKRVYKSLVDSLFFFVS